MLGYSWFIPSWVAEDRVARLKHLNVLLDITHNENISCVAAFISDAVPRSTNPDQIAVGNGGGDSVGGTAGWSQAAARSQPCQTWQVEWLHLHGLSRKLREENNGEPQEISKHTWLC